MDIDFILSTVPLAAAAAIIIYLLRADWKRYGLLLLLAAAAGVAACRLFVRLGLYEFPYRLFPKTFDFPILTILLVFPAYSAAAVRWSPKSWAWKVPYYWTLVHLVTLVEALAKEFTSIIRYSSSWFLWESYILWWAFLLAFEWLGGVIVPPEKRRPLGAAAFRYGKAGFYVVHAVLIATFFLAGLYVGIKIRHG